MSRLPFTDERVLTMAFEVTESELDAEILATFDRAGANGRVDIRITREDFRGEPQAVVSMWRAGPDGEVCRTGRGFYIRAHELPAAVRALESVIGSAEEAGFDVRGSHR